MMLFGRTTKIGDGGFTPSGSPVGYWSADTITGLSDGDPVGTWPDQSGTGNNLTQGTAAQKPTFKVNILNNKPVVRFDGTSDNMSIPQLNGGVAADWTFHFVSANQGAGTYQFLVDSQFGRLIVAYAYNGKYKYYTSDGYVGNINAAAGNQILTFILDTADNGMIYKNGVSIDGPLLCAAMAVGGATKLGSLYNPVQWFYAGDLGEIIFYTSALSAGDRGANESGLNTKYSVY